LAVLWGVKLLFARPVSWVWSPMHVPVVLFVAYAALRTLWSPVPHDSRLELLHVLLYALVYFVAAVNFYRPTDRRVMVWALMAVAVGEAMYGTWQYATQSDRALWVVRPLQYALRGGGTFICPNHLAGFLTMVCGVALARVIVDPTPSRSLQKNVLFKLLEVYVIGCAIAGLVASQSRGGWLATGLAVVAALFWFWRVRALPPRVVDAAFGVVIVVAIFAYSRPAIRQRLQDSFAIRLDYTFEDFKPVEIKDPNLGGRAALNQVSWRIAKDHVWFGTGPGTWQWVAPRFQDTQTKYAHNDVLQLLTEYGLVGWLMGLGVFACFFWQVVRFTRPASTSEQHAFAIGAATAITGLLIHSFWDFNLHIPANAFLLVSLLGLVAANSDGRLPFQRIELSRRARGILGAGVLVAACLAAFLSLPATQVARLTRQGDDARAAGELNQAAAAYQRAIAFDRRSADAYLGLGDTYRSRVRKNVNGEDVDRALAAYRTAAGLNPLDPRPYQRIAALHETLGDHARALAAHQQCVTLAPNHPAYLLRLGLAHWRLGQIPEAVAAFEKAADLGDSDARLHLAKLRAPKSKGR
jgi:O-antigen ligase/Flp pilus assembly protein TadD